MTAYRVQELGVLRSGLEGKGVQLQLDVSVQTTSNSSTRCRKCLAVGTKQLDEPRFFSVLVGGKIELPGNRQLIKLTQAESPSVLRGSCLGSLAVLMNDEMCGVVSCLEKFGSGWRSSMTLLCEEESRVMNLGGLKRLQ